MIGKALLRAMVSHIIDRRGCDFRVPDAHSIGLTNALSLIKLIIAFNPWRVLKAGLEQRVRLFREWGAKCAGRVGQQVYKLDLGEIVADLDCAKRGVVHAQAME